MQTRVSRMNSAAEICRICLQIFREPYTTVCGHTFCRTCITKQIASKPNCPMCETDIDPTNRTHLIPNHTAAALIENVRRTRRSATSLKRMASDVNHDQDLFAVTKLISNPLTSAQTIEEALVEFKKRRCDLTLSEKRSVLLNEFLDRMIEQRDAQLQRIHDELIQLKADKTKVNDLFKLEPSSTVHRLVPDSDPTPSASPIQASSSHEEVSKLKKRIRPNLSSLEACYFELKNDHYNTDNPVLEHSSSGLGGHLQDFSDVLTGMSRYAQIKRRATLNYSLEASSSLSIVSSIEFDRDGEYFVVAGVSKKIKLYDYNAVVYSDTGIHYPLQQLQCDSKISNVSWNPYIKNILASSDYEGRVQLWDTSMCRKIQSFREHEKRCWTVQFNNVDPHLMASGSDDAKVKIWAMDQQHSVCTVDAKVNVCCVYFSPTSRNNFVFGSADHCVHLYDLRNTSRAVNIFRGHRKAVSYVKYCNENEVVSASTDSNLRLWDVKTGMCKRIMRGHQNEKNFVGLATDGNHIVCGSENNQLYVYYKNIAEPMMRYDFTSRQSDKESVDTALLSNTEHTCNEFVSAVCWKKNSNIVVAANSQGTTHILELL